MDAGMQLVPYDDFRGGRLPVGHLVLASNIKSELGRGGQGFSVPYPDQAREPILVAPRKIAQHVPAPKAAGEVSRPVLDLYAHGVGVGSLVPAVAPGGRGVIKIVSRI